MKAEIKCKDCPNRRVGCHNVETCSFWAEHEKKKEKIYDKRKNCYERVASEKAYFRRKMKRHDHDHRR